MGKGFNRSGAKMPEGDEMSYRLHPISLDSVINLIRNGRAGEVYVRLKSLAYPHYMPLPLVHDRHLIDWITTEFYQEISTEFDLLD